MPSKDAGGRRPLQGAIHFSLGHPPAREEQKTRFLTPIARASWRSLLIRYRVYSTALNLGFDLNGNYEDGPSSIALVLQQL